jgi:hypothetical protein
VVVAGDDAAAGFVRVLKAEARRVLGYPERPDEIWDASQVSPRDWFYNRAQAAVRSLLPRLRFSDGEEGGLTIEVASPEREQVLIGSAGDLAWFTRLSSGERSLVDEAMLDAAAALRSDMLDLGATVGMLHTADQDELVDLLVDLEPFLDWLHEEYWDVAVVDAVVAWGRRKCAERFGRPFRSDVPVVRVFDEPERHLHPGAREDLAAVLHERGDVGGGAVVIATHAVEFLARDGWQHLHLYATPEGAVIDDFDPSDLDRAHGVARDLGIRSGELLTRYRYLLLVEGAHDEAFLDGYCGGLLRTLGVLVLPMYGAHEVLQAAEMHLVARYLDVGIGVLLDHARTPRSKEAELMADLTKVAKRRGIGVDLYRLRRPDIIAYLDDDEVRRDAPAFPGFHEVERRWRQPPRDSDFKQLASDLAGGFRFTRHSIQSIAKRTASCGRRQPQDLADVLADLTSAARRQRPNWTVG